MEFNEKENDKKPEKPLIEDNGVEGEQLLDDVVLGGYGVHVYEVVLLGEYEEYKKGVG